MTINTQVSFTNLDLTTTVTLMNPANPRTKQSFALGKTIVTPTGQRITQVLYEGYKFKLKWDGLDNASYEDITDFLSQYGYEGFIFEDIDGDQYTCVVDGLSDPTETIAHARLANVTRHSLTLNLVTIP